MYNTFSAVIQILIVEDKIHVCRETSKTYRLYYMYMKEVTCKNFCRILVFQHLYIYSIEYRMLDYHVYM